MKTCHVCNTLVEDQDLVCPICGSTVVASTGGLTLKPDAIKRKANPMGTTVSTGSGLTDILRGEEGDSEFENQDEYYGASIPLSLSKTIIEDDMDYKKQQRKKKIKRYVQYSIFAIVLILIVVFVSKRFFGREKGASSYEQVISMYMESINSGDAESLTKIIPPYITNPNSYAEKIISAADGVNLTKYDIKKFEYLNQAKLNDLQDSIKYQTSKTSNLQNAVSCDLFFIGKYSKDNVEKGVSMDLNMQIVQIRDRWYMHIDTYADPDFNYN